MYECSKCGAEVSAHYWRVFSVEGELHGCLNCEPKNGVRMPFESGTPAGTAEG